MTSPWRCAGSFSAPPKQQQFLCGGRVKSAAKAREEEESGTYKNNKAFEALRDVRKLQRHEQQQRDVVVGTDGDGKNDGTTGGDDVDVVVAARDEERKTTTKMKKTPKNPFEEARRKPSASSTTTASNSSLKTFSFVKSTVDVSRLPSLRDADVTLRRFDDEARKRLSSSSSSSSSSSASCAERSLGNAVRALSYNAETIMFGICAQTGHEGIDALKVWTEELNLPKGKLHGLDTDGVPKPIPEGPVFIKYNSLSGDAFCSEYHGEFRGVLFTPVLNDGVFRQFGYLDLSLLDDDDDDEKNKT